ncbi:polysaccharide deacetylase family protein [Massilia alkalitolerans]|jgi:peptidoglycan/xylan/chitin deacetylase (PgdA/CDA1 family)|uniref:polysaccharide deacetylase family protein n=1 Tax=Massilia alkalitolerans TaxID=286638 RepID=UPI00056AD9D9|nr:polysaccharide deacetylase family protein [Massilia alkalitolerans]
MKRLAGVLLAALALPAGAAERFDIAITVDDLPMHGQLPPGMTRLGIAHSTLDTLKAHGVPEAFGFVNSAKIAREPGSEAVLDAWRAAGYPLGNHTATHMNLARAESFAAWREDVIAGEPAVAERMPGLEWRWLRFPNLAAGSRLEEALAFLGPRGYRVADVSVSFSDWDYTDAYARCVGKNDGATIDAMKRQFLDDVDKGIVRMKEDSRRVFGRVIPQVYLMHLGGWSAVTLPEVMKRLDAAGARYVTLAQAHADPVYAKPGGGSVITRVVKERGISLSGGEGAPATPRLDPKTLCR